LAGTTSSEVDTPFDLILPDGQIADFPVQSSLQKYSCSLLTQITSISFAIPHPQEGRIAIVTDAGWDVVDATVPLTNGTQADGKDVWS
jgi:hypothetical protein